MIIEILLHKLAVDTRRIFASLPFRPWQHSFLLRHNSVLLVCSSCVPEYLSPLPALILHSIVITATLEYNGDDGNDGRGIRQSRQTFRDCDHGG